MYGSIKTASLEPTAGNGIRSMKGLVAEARRRRWNRMPPSQKTLARGSDDEELARGADDEDVICSYSVAASTPSSPDAHVMTD